MNAYATPTSGKWLGAVPSRTLDKNLSSAEFTDEVSLRLGVDVSDGGCPCRFCGVVCDCKGRHALSCTAGGDTNLEHNEVRDAFFDYCRRARMSPEQEAPRLLTNMTTVIIAGGQQTS